MQQFEGFRPVNIGSRGSPLAMVQARLVQRLLGEQWGIDTSERDRVLPIHVFTTTGDKVTGALSDSGGKGLFVKELDEALADERIDLAVHSMKDVPTAIESCFALPAILEREDVRDAFISERFNSFLELPLGSCLGTASLRRQAQALRLRPDLTVKLLRGNVGTRLRRLSEGFCDATFLAVAGLNRLGQVEHIRSYIDIETMLPAPAQGAVGVQIRRNDTRLHTLLAPLNHTDTQICISAERAFLKSLDGSCRTPIAALAQIDGGCLRFRGQALTPFGMDSFERDETISLGPQPIIEAENLGAKLGAQIKVEAGPALNWNS